MRWGRVHVGVVVGDIETVNGRWEMASAKRWRRMARRFRSMTKMDVGPADKIFGDVDAAGGFGAGGFDGVAWEVFEDLFGGGASPLIAAADEKEFGWLFFSGRKIGS